jgi:hypothetical protein
MRLAQKPAKFIILTERCLAFKPHEKTIAYRRYFI